MPHPLASLPCTHSAPSLPLALHFTWSTLLAQQAQVAALVDTAQRQHQAVTPHNPYETPKAKRMAADADLSSGTGLEPCPFEPCPFE